MLSGIGVPSILGRRNYRQPGQRMVAVGLSAVNTATDEWFCLFSKMIFSEVSGSNHQNFSFLDCSTFCFMELMQHWTRAYSSGCRKCWKADFRSQLQIRSRIKTYKFQHSGFHISKAESFVQTRPPRKHGLAMKHCCTAHRKTNKQ